MPKKGYTVLTVKDTTIEKLQFWKLEDESWTDFLDRLITGFNAALTVINTELGPKYAPFAKFKELVK